MPDSNHNSFPTAPRSQATSWILARLTSTPSHSRTQSVLLVVGLVVLIGFVDYLVGVRISLQFFYLIPVVLSVAWLGWRAGCVTAIFALMARVMSDLAGGFWIYHHLPIPDYIWNRLIDLSVALALAWVMHALISLHREQETRVRQRTAALEQAIATRDQLQSQLFEISRRERSAIGHDLHDGLGQHLTATAIAANLLARQLAMRGDPSAKDASKIENLIQEGIGKTRQIARGLLLAAIEPEELVPELEELATKIGDEQHVACTFTKQGDFSKLTAAIASHLFYIAQEATHNAVRHARPTRLEISLVEEKNTLVLTATDNGTGLPPLDPHQPGMGLRIMVHRAELIGGELSISRAPGSGTLVRCRVPLSNPLPASTAG
ncbi:MAG TPA: sensor histidine kinase [Opitutaceae bacterium]|jgi:signal transduction histidine kinase|nr:sensor histidine kinase [Opitutaceae bacterium]